MDERANVWSKAKKGGGARHGGRICTASDTENMQYRFTLARLAWDLRPLRWQLHLRMLDFVRSREDGQVCRHNGSVMG